jgi:hypothetical protein
MNLSILVYSGLSSLMLGGIIWLVAWPLGSQSSFSDSEAAQPELESLFLLHCRYFAQIRRVLGQGDRHFLRGRLSGAEIASWGEERRQVLKRFLAALGDDYARLDFLSRRIAALSPRIQRRHELQRIWLGLRFRMLYRVVVMRLAIEGLVPVESMAKLTGVLGALSYELEGSMCDLERSAEAELVGIR